MKKFWNEFGPFLLTIVAVLFIRQFIIAPISVNGTSMYPTLNDKDIMILNKIGYEVDGLERFDIVVIKYHDKYLIKRVIGLPGDNIKYKDNELYINDEYVEEPFLEDDVVTWDFEMVGTVPEDSYFVMGDNRVVSMDSRDLGTFKKSRIIGKTNFTVYPFSNFGTKK